ncbi:MAG TPA: phosphoglycerate kinase [Blastocatellia bacterium]|nr:phosphoglycerate kinase [Blastocatellia bacterium]
MAKLSIEDLELEGKRLFLRVDFNVPIDSQGRVGDDTRIRASLPTVKYAIERGARVILASHLGRPKGKVDPKYSLAPAALRLADLLGKQVRMAPDSAGPEVVAMANSLASGEVLMLENVRFHPGEEKNAPEYARDLADLADVFVNDAFGTAHRAHASTEGITHYVAKSAAGLLMVKELRYLGQALSDPARPFLVILGGAKVSDKIPVIKNLLKHADTILIGGAMAYTFLKSEGVQVGRSLVEDDKIELARELAAEARTAGVRLVLPADNLVVEKERWDKDKASASPRSCSVRDIRPEEAGLDIGPDAIAAYRAEVAQASTIVWNGPMGVFEQPPFDRGTRAIALALVESKATTIVGGGDSVAAVVEAGVAGRITHISTGGGASLEFLAGATLPGVAALTDK